MSNIEITDLPLIQQVIYLGYMSDDLIIKGDIPKCHIKYAPEVTFVNGDNNITFKRHEIPDRVEIVFETQPAIWQHPILLVNGTIQEATINTSIIATGSLHQILIVVRDFINSKILPDVKIKYTNMPIGYLLSMRIALEDLLLTTGRTINSEEWSIDLVTIKRLDKLFAAIRDVQREEPGMAWLIENRALIIDNHLTDNVYIEVKNNEGSETVTFTPTVIEDEFDFYIQLHKEIMVKFGTHPLLKTVSAAWDEWEEAMYTAIQLVTGKAPYQAVTTSKNKMVEDAFKSNVPAAIYSNQIYISKE